MKGGPKSLLRPFLHRALQFWCNKAGQLVPISNLDNPYLKIVTFIWYMQIANITASFPTFRENLKYTVKLKNEGEKLHVENNLT